MVIVIIYFIPAVVDLSPRLLYTIKIEEVSKNIQKPSSIVSKFCTETIRIIAKTVQLIIIGYSYLLNFFMVNQLFAISKENKENNMIKEAFINPFTKV